MTLNLDDETAARSKASTTTTAAAPALADDGGAPPGQDRQVKRNQVRRACDWCKLMRIKCDNDRPCFHCVESGRECRMSGKNQFRSIAAAVKYDDTPPFFLAK